MTSVSRQGYILLIIHCVLPLSAFSLFCPTERSLSSVWSIQDSNFIVLLFRGRDGVEALNQPRPTAKNTVERDREAYLTGRFKADTWFTRLLQIY